MLRTPHSGGHLERGPESSFGWPPFLGGACRRVFPANRRRRGGHFRDVETLKTLLRELIERKNQGASWPTWFTGAQQGVASQCRSRRGGATTAPPTNSFNPLLRRGRVGGQLPDPIDGDIALRPLVLRIKHMIHRRPTPRRGLPGPSVAASESSD